ncbi:beta strand repeat-containing protein [Ostreibacterium oceani]|uniref:Autotransporter outer membrane beta-barrel domain-containing protein n=1 Tax=Ostreibacterium oceani TaxID=2654998 RepID=A0A6N7EZT9_9GAMM|nr:hypothetical protein [Ostreibacterium oceani]MPV86647.1 hypothetical protein [Ostreibacterium oceani]
MQLKRKKIHTYIALLAVSSAPLYVLAVDECGIGAAVTCSDPSYTAGITYNNQDAGLTLTLDNAATTISNGGDRGIDIRATNAGTGDIIVNADLFSSITTANNGRQGIFVRNQGSGNSTVNLGGTGMIDTTGNGGYGSRIFNALGNAASVIDGVTVTTVGQQASAVSSDIDGSTSETLTTSTEMQSGTISTGDAGNIGVTNTVTAGRFSSGIRARHDSGGLSTATMTGGAITTYGFNAPAVNASQSDTGGIATMPFATTANLSGGTITTRGGAGHGVFSRSDVGLGDVIANVTGGSITLDYSGTFDTSSAVFAFNNVLNANGTGNTEINFSDATATTTGDLTTGLKAWNRFRAAGNGGDTTVTVGDNATVTTDGATGAGVIALSDQNNTSVSVAESSTITSSGAGAVGLAAVGNTSVTVDIDGTVTGGDAGDVDVFYRRNTSVTGVTRLVSAGGNGSGVLVGSGAFDGSTDAFTANTNPVTVNVNATADVSADSGYGIIAESGNVTINHQGAVAGFIDLASGDDVWNWTAGSFDTGSFLGGDGSDTANISGIGATELSAVVLLDGGDDVDSANGMVDTLNYDGITGDAPDMMNWELTNVINGANVTFANNFETEILTNDSASTAVLADALTITGDVVNDGTMNMQSGTATGTATIDGNLTGIGTLTISVDVSSANAADVLTVTGDSTGASIVIDPTPISADPATGINVLVARVNGTTAVGDFTLPGGATSLDINGVTYDLVLIGNNWFLSTGLNNPANIPSTSVWALLAAMLAMATMVMATVTTAGRRQARQCAE